MLIEKPVWGTPLAPDTPEEITNEKLNQMVSYTDDRLRPRGDYDNETNYFTNDLVEHEEISYRALAASLGVTPGTDMAKWKRIGGGGDGVSSWNDLDDKPATFPASAHTHPQNQVDGLVDALAAKATQGGLDAHTSNTNNPHGVTKAQVGLANVDNTSDANKPVSSATSAALANKADLVGGVIPAAQLPAFVDDVLEFANLAAFPATGESGKVYIALDTNQTYRWSGSVYVVLGSGGVAIGETSSTAYRGDRGKIAYDHSQLTNTNPHGVTKSHVGLSNVDNTSDANKPISSGTQTALNSKADQTLSNLSNATTARTNLAVNDVIFAPYVSGKPAGGATIYEIELPVALYFLGHFPGSRVTAGTAATSACVFKLQKDGVDAATISFAAGATVATLASAGGGLVAGAIDNRLSIIAPATPDATLANIRFRLNAARY